MFCTEISLLAQAFDKLVDPTTGHVYYYNNKTGEAQWTKPMQVPLLPAEIALTVRVFIAEAVPTVLILLTFALLLSTEIALTVPTFFTEIVPTVEHAG
jgi:hypothetical protein